jgi:DNA-binding XRE family transcriptional regulator
VSTYLRHRCDLRLWRREKGYTQGSLSEALREAGAGDVSRSRVSLFEVGIQVPTLSVARLISKLVDAPLGDIWPDAFTREMIVKGSG